MRITLVRHGTTEWNAAKRFQGHSNIPVNAEGISQAGTLAQKLAGERFDVIVSSDLTRCRQTAEIICESRKEKMLFDARWRERNFGVWEGLTWDEIVTRGLNTESPAEGETFESVRARVHEAFLALQEQRHENILVVTHSGPIHALISLLVPDVDALSMRIDPASITRVSASVIPNGVSGGHAVEG